MDPGILAAVVILGVELVIIIAVIIYLFCGPKKKQEKSQLPADAQPVGSTPGHVTFIDEKEEAKEKEIKEDKQDIVKPNGQEKQNEVNTGVDGKGNDCEFSNDADQSDERSINDKIPSQPEKDSSSSSSDEGVGDVEKPSVASSSESSSSEDEENIPSDNEKEKPAADVSIPLENGELRSSSSSSTSSSESEETKEEDQVVAKQAEEMAQPAEREAPLPGSDERQASTHSSTLGSLDAGITLSLRLDNQAVAVASSPSSSSSSSSSCSSSEENIKVIRTYDAVPPKHSNGDIATIYDAAKQKDMTHIHRVSSSSDREGDRPMAMGEEEVVAGIINVTSGEKLTICGAVSKGLIPEKTGILLLEAQAATGSIVNPRNAVKMSVTDAIKRGVVDSKYRVSLSASEGAYYGYLDPRRNESVPLFEAMRRGIFPRAQGMRLLEAQVATGGIIDPWTGMRYSLEGARSKGLIDKATVKVLKNPEEHTDFFDPNTKQRFSYGDLLSKCIRDLDTGLKFLYIEEKPKTNAAHYQADLLTFRSAFRRKVSFQDLISAGLVDKRNIDLFNRGQITKDDLSEILKPFLVGEQPIAGIYNRARMEVLTICQAVKAGLLRKGTALELLEAQAATGNIIDPKSGKQMSVGRAISIGLVDRHFAGPLRRAELAVMGYQNDDRSRTVSLYEAMNRGQVLEVNGIRLLDAQIATGGLIDPVGGYRIPISVATKRGLLDQRLVDALTHPSPDQKAFYDPNTGENLTYAEILRRSVVDKKKHIGMRLLSIDDKAANVRVVSKGQARNKKVVVMNPQTRKPMSLKQAVADGVIDASTARDLQAHQGSWGEAVA